VPLDKSRRRKEKATGRGEGKVRKVQRCSQDSEGLVVLWNEQREAAEQKETNRKGEGTFTIRKKVACSEVGKVGLGEVGLGNKEEREGTFPRKRNRALQPY